MHDIISTSYVLLEAGNAYRVRVRKRSEQPLGELLAGKGCGVPVLQLEIEYQILFIERLRAGNVGYSLAGWGDDTSRRAGAAMASYDPLAALWFVCARVHVACEQHLVAGG